MKKRNLKGFTLLELIIVMAIFSVIMAGAMSLVDPVSTIHKRAVTGENSYAFVDNIQNYLQDSLEYADNVWVLQGDFTDDELAEKAFDFKKTYYNDLIAKKNKDTETNYSNCKIRVMTVLNKDTDSFQKGQILMQTVTYKSDYASATPTPDTALALSAKTAQLNDACFNDAYSFDYVLGAGNLINTDADHLALDSLYKEEPIKVPENITPSSFALTIVAYMNKPDRNGNVVEDIDVTFGTETYTIKQYPSATHYTIANLPLFNIIQRNGNPNNSYWIRGLDDGGNETWASARHCNVAASPFSCDIANISMGKDDNIYIIYAMADEIATPLT